jgi:MFS superfamily sulfate permease-like transporter
MMELGQIAHFILPCAGILVAVVLSTVLSAMLKWHEKHGVPVVGTITAGFKMPTPPGTWLFPKKS